MSDSFNTNKKKFCKTAESVVLERELLELEAELQRLRASREPGPGNVTPDSKGGARNSEAAPGALSPKPLSPALERLVACRPLLDARLAALGRGPFTIHRDFSAIHPTPSAAGQSVPADPASAPTSTATRPVPALPSSSGEDPRIFVAWLKASLPADEARLRRLVASLEADRAAPSTLNPSPTKATSWQAPAPTHTTTPSPSPFPSSSFSNPSSSSSYRPLPDAVLELVEKRWARIQAKTVKVEKRPRREGTDQFSNQQF